MKLISKLGIVLATTVIVACAPRDTVHYYSISDALNSSEAKNALNPRIKLYFGKAAPGKVVIPNAVTNKKTNAANKTDEESCRWAFISAVKQLQERAEKEGATKVGNVISFYKKRPYQSTSQYECHAGNLISGVALKGQIVK